MADDNILLAWTFPEFVQHQHSRAWWWSFAAVALGLLLFAVLTGNFLFALIIIMIVAIILFRHYHEPGEISFQIIEQGIVVDGKLYRWSELSHFWLVYEPPGIKNLFIEFNSSLKPHLTVPLDEQNPLEVREVLGEYLDEDLERETEPTSDALGRLLKI